MPKTDVRLLAEFMKYSRPKKKPCPIGFAVDSGGVAADEHAALAAACATDPGVIPSGAISTWLEKRGVTVSIPAVTAHRRGTCTCGDDDA